MNAPEFRDGILVDGVPVTIRTMHAEDRDIEQSFVRSLSNESRYYRFHSTIRELTPEMLERFTHPNYPDEMALIATIPSPNGVTERQIGVARYARIPDTNEAEMAVVVADDWHHKGVATRLLLALRRCAMDAGIETFHASVLPDNKRMYSLAKKLGFNMEPRGDLGTVELGKRFRDFDADES